MAKVTIVLSFPAHFGNLDQTLSTRGLIIMYVATQLFVAMTLVYLISNEINACNIPYVNMRCVSVQPIALGMGLNIQTYKLWKDRAMLELNVAVLHSFQVKQHLHVHTLCSRICVL